ncbi:hypothetical protein K1T71_012694 [Dendrolimus kikuchii]|uniref:Uncharacterized protein n=1 Tax=Dendrolimus kikuchii TaxID=765133 RepID=A0ACC1CK16_9NEOP|nr:hypothetical protein K1T71_012694 [Dendrolimus kikuchii]
MFISYIVFCTSFSIRHILAKPQSMDVLRQFQSLAWCKPDWCFPSMSKETNELLYQCSQMPKPELTDDIDEVIRRSKAFPIPHPVPNVRLENLKERRPIDRLRRNIASTYPILHERVLLLITHFLIYKREYGSSMEKAFYKDMTVPEFIDRLLKKRAVVFMDAWDEYKLITGEEGKDGWESIGSMHQRPPLLLENCLSYDEIKLSAMLYVSGPTECINDGGRVNNGELQEKDIEQEAIIIGTIGARFERRNRMEYEDILITEQQNCPENGYGEEVTPTTCLNVLKTTYVRNNQSARHMWRQMWAEFYQVHSYTYEELTSYINIQDKGEESQYTERYVRLPQQDTVFDNEVYYKRVAILAETTLLEAEYRARGQHKMAFLNVIGCGLGVWKISSHQSDVYVLTFLERIRAMLRRDLLNHVSDVNFAYIRTSSSITGLFTNSSNTENESPVERRIFFESKRHPNGGINVQMENREPSSRLSGEHEGKLLVMTYPWDGNAHPGNEFWLGSLSGSGDPAAACSTQISELHNAHVNANVRASNAHVATASGVAHIRDYTRSSTDT